LPADASGSGRYGTQIGSTGTLTPTFWRQSAILPIGGIIIPISSNTTERKKGVEEFPDQEGRVKSSRKRGMKSSTTTNTQTANTQTAGQDNGQDNGKAGAVEGQSKRRRLVKPSAKVRENIEDANVVKAARVKRSPKKTPRRTRRRRVLC
jgi:hypothetical protein